MIVQIQPYGDNGLIVNFEQSLNKTTNFQVFELKNRIEKVRPNGFLYCIPAYCSLTIGYDSLKISFAELKNIINKQLGKPFKKDKTSKTKTILIPVCYDTEYGLDMEDVSESTSMSLESIIDLHTHTNYHVYMLGFIPGFAYLGNLPPSLSTNRKQTPRIHVPPRSVAIAGLQTAVYPSQSPGGWQIIGRTPLPVYNVNLSNPFLLSPGDTVKFERIQKRTYKKLLAQNNLIDQQ